MTNGIKITAPKVHDLSQKKSDLKILRVEQTYPFPVNAFVVEGKCGIVIIDATLTNTASRFIRSMVDGIGKPVDAVLLTHAHPDHYAGLHNVTNGLDVPIISLPAIRDLARRDDKLKNDFFSPMLGSEWPTERIFPTHTVKEGETLRFGDISFDVMDIGPAESHHDSIFILRDSEPTAFIGDLAYTLMHPYMVDTHNDKWIRALDRMQSEFSEGTIFHVGHGPAVTPIFLRGQVDYLRMFEKCLRAEDWSDEKEAFEKIFNKMREYLPHDELLPLLEWSILPNAKNLGLI